MEANVLPANTPDSPAPKEKAVKFVLWLGLVSIGMMFAGLTSGYIVRRDTGSWLKFEMPAQFWYGTAVILISSISMNWALQSAKKSNYTNLSRAIFLTFLLGILFTCCQFMAWGAMVKANIYVMGSQSSASGSYLYIISGLHLAHIIGGLLALMVVFYKSYKQKYSAQNYLGVKLCATYWHFLAGLWVYLFLFMLFIR